MDLKTNDNITGKQISKYDNGEIESILFLKEGKRDSIAQWFYPDGSIEIQVYYEKGIKVGGLSSFYQTGFLNTYNFYNQNGDLFYHKSMTSDGFLKSEKGLPLFIGSENDFQKLHLDSILLLKIYCATPPNVNYDLSVGLKRDGEFDTFYKQKIENEMPSLKILFDSEGEKELYITAKLQDTLLGTIYRDTAIYKLYVVNSLLQ